MLASGLTDPAVPTFEGPMLEVLGMSSDGDGWNMEYADLNNLEEVNGIRFFEDTKLYGTITP